MLSKLIKIRLASLFTGRKGKNVKPSRFGKIGIGILLGFLALIFLLYFSAIASILAMVLVPAGLDSMYFGIFDLLIFAIVFVLSVFETKSELFECKDNDLLLSMPVKPNDIVLSRAFTVIIMNIVEAFFVMSPAIVFYVLEGGNPWYIASVVPVTVLLALLATALSSGVGFLVAKISARFKNNTLVSVVLTIAFLVLYFVGFDWLMTAMDQLEIDPEGAIASLSESMGFIGIIGDCSLAKPLNLLIFIVISVAISLATFLIITKNYFAIISHTGYSGKKKYVKTTLRSSSLLLALSKKELATLFSNSAYILNGGMGVIFEVLMSVLLLANGEGISEMLFLFGFGADEGMLATLASALLFGFASLNSVSASALSLEGKYFWIVKSSPIPTETLIYAKLVPHLALSLPASLVSSVIVSIALGLTPLWWIPVILIPILGCFVFAMLGLILNIAMPKLEFENPTQVVKQSMPVFLLSFGGMIFLMAAVAVSFMAVAFLGSLVTVLLMLAISILLCVVLYLILMGPSARRLGKIS
ncbi:MAG: hypothetical protein IKC32_05740 [Clostridia bacterium]|nr:hypothetical protein [Clostridia bacterium]